MGNNADPTKVNMLVLRSQAGDKAAFDQLLKSVQAQLWRYVLRLTGNREMAEDVLQEVFLILYRKIGWLNDPKLFLAWAYRIASRESFRYLKKENRQSEHIRDGDIPDMFPVIENAPEYEPELIAKIPALLAEVSPASRAVLILHYLDELTLNDTAEILDISSGTVKSRLAYGLDTLRRRIKETT